MQKERETRSRGKRSKEAGNTILFQIWSSKHNLSPHWSHTIMISTNFMLKSQVTAKILAVL